MRRYHALRLYVQTGDTLNKLGGRIDQLAENFGDRPEYADVRRMAESCFACLVEVEKGIEYMECRFRGQSQAEAYSHVFNRKSGTVGGKVGDSVVSDALGDQSSSGVDSAKTDAVRDTG